MSLKVKNGTIKNVAGTQEVVHTGTIDSELSSFSQNPIEGNVIKDTLDLITPSFDKPEHNSADFNSNLYITTDELNTIQESRNKLAADLNNKIKKKNDVNKDGGYLYAGSNVTITNSDENTIVTGNTSIYAPDFRNSSNNELSITSPKVFMLKQSDVDGSGIIMEHFGCFSVDKLRTFDRFDFYVTEDIYTTDAALQFANSKKNIVGYSCLPLYNYEAIEAAALGLSGSPYYQFRENGNNVVNLANCVQQAYPKHGFDETTTTKDIYYALTLSNAVSFWMWNSSTNYRVVSMQPLLTSLINGKRGSLSIFATKGTAFTVIYNKTNDSFRILNNPLMVNVPFYKVFFCDDSYGSYIYDETISGYLKYRADKSWSFDGVFPTTKPETARSSTQSSNRWRLFLPIMDLNWNKTVEINGYLGVNSSATGSFTVNNRQARSNSSYTADREALMAPDENYSFITNRCEAYSNTKVMSLRGKL